VGNLAGLMLVSGHSAGLGVIKPSTDRWMHGHAGAQARAHLVLKGNCGRCQRVLWLAAVLQDTHGMICFCQNRVLHAGAGARDAEGLFQSLSVGLPVGGGSALHTPHKIPFSEKGKGTG